jgi:hypothetical protein
MNRRFTAAIAASLLVSVFVATNAPAQVAELPGTFTVTPAAGTSPLTVTIAWDVSTFTGALCTAGGSWTGTKPLTGTQTVTNLTANANYTLTCTRSIRASASLQWTAPTRNTDGTTLTTLAGFRISYGQNATALTNTVQVGSPTTTNYIVGNLDAGTWHFGVRAYTTTGVESDLSNIVTKVATTTVDTRSTTRTVTVTPPIPEPPVLQVVDNRVFNATPDYSLLAFRAGKQYGTVALGTRCDQTRPVSGGWYPVPNSAVRWASMARTAYPVAMCVVR